MSIHFLHVSSNKQIELLKREFVLSFNPKKHFLKKYTVRCKFTKWKKGSKTSERIMHFSVIFSMRKSRRPQENITNLMNLLKKVNQTKLVSFQYIWSIYNKRVQGSGGGKIPPESVLEGMFTSVGLYTSKRLKTTLNSNVSFIKPLIL